MSDLPRIEAVVPMGWPKLGIQWRDGLSATVDLGGWIMTGGEVLAPLREPALFATARIGTHHASLFWDDPDGDLAIDSAHLRLIEEEQRLAKAIDLTGWQQAVGLSNQEAADFFDVAPSTWSAYKAGAKIPAVIAMLARAAQRDPLLLQAHYHPRRNGRPRKEG